MYFTQDDFIKIEQWLQTRTIKDSQFDLVTALNGDETVPILQDGRNRRTLLQDIYIYAHRLEVLNNLDEVVNLTKTQNTQGAWVLSADVRLYNDNKNILIKKGNTLAVFANQDNVYFDNLTLKNWWNARNKEISDNFQDYFDYKKLNNARWVDQATTNQGFDSDLSSHNERLLVIEDTLEGLLVNEADYIDNVREVINFFNGVSDKDTFNNILNGINGNINNVDNKVDVIRGTELSHIHHGDKETFTTTASDVKLNFTCYVNDEDDSYSSTSYNISIPVATTEKAGIITATDKTRIDLIPGITTSITNINNDINSINTSITGINSSITDINTSLDSIDEDIAAIYSNLDTKVDKVPGKSLSTNDYTTTEKNKLADIANNANNYSLPTASSSVKGGIKVGSRLSISSETLSADVQIKWRIIE